MELLLAVVAGVLYATGLYLMLRRRLAQLIIGTHAVIEDKVGFFISGGGREGRAGLTRGNFFKYPRPAGEPLPPRVGH